MNTRIIKSVFALVCIGVLLSASLAQQTSAPAPAKQSSQDRVELHQALLDLTNPWTVMCIAAHPDDEDGTSLIVMRRKYGAHTVSLFTTFGEGGQNAIGPELYEELGAIRVKETEAAAEIQGSEPHFLRLKDFGYSKSADEAFRVWGHEEALRRMVLQIRKLRPDVIITNHSANNNDHGHHQATARLELEAFDAAADPKRFPEQLRDGVRVWQVQRLFVRAGRSNQAQTDGSGLVSIDPNERDPIRGTTYAEEALQALQQHATQGPWPRTVEEMARFRNSADGKLPLIRYRLVREVKGGAPLANESHNFLDGLRLPDHLAKQFAPPTIDGQPLTKFINQRERVLDALISAKKSRSGQKTDQGDDRFRVYRMDALLDNALGIAAGLVVSITPVSPVLIRNSKNEFLVNISNEGSNSPWVIATHSDAGDSTQEKFLEIVDKRPYQIAPGKADILRITYHASADAPLTFPHSEHLYDGRLFTQWAAMNLALRLNEVNFSMSVKTRFDIAPTVELIDIAPSPIVLNARKSVNDPVLRFKLINHTAVPKQVNILAWSSHRKFTPKNCRFDLAAHSHQSATCAIAGLEVPAPFSQNAVLAREKINLTVQELKTQRVLGSNYFHAVWTDAEVAPDVRVGYIRGFDYSVPNALAPLGVPSKELKIADVRDGDLQQFSAIIIDNRVYESQPELIAANQRLLDYTKEGGTLIVFYHKSNEWNPDPRRNRPQLGPFPIILGDERVTDEDAPVTVMIPGHRLLSFPNKIDQVDFNGWIQERGLYYPKDWDVQYQALLAMNDPGEAPLKGGLLVADYGRGHYIYTSMVWYRQLRAGVPGAYRMLANMISYGKVAQTSVCDPILPGLPRELWGDAE